MQATCETVRTLRSATGSVGLADESSRRSTPS